MGLSATKSEPDDLIAKTNGKAVNFAQFAMDGILPPDIMLKTNGVWDINYAFVDPPTLNSISFGAGLSGDASYYTAIAATNGQADPNHAGNGAFSNAIPVSDIIQQAVNAILKPDGVNVEPTSGLMFRDVANIDIGLKPSTDTSVAIQIGNLPYNDATSSVFVNSQGQSTQNIIAATFGGPGVQIGTNMSIGKYGDIWLDNNFTVQNQAGGGWTAAALQPGGPLFAVLIHEIGHALGLDHPDEGDPNATNVDARFTIMTAGYPENIATPSNPQYLQGLQLDDVKAIQSIYGSNYAYHSGNDDYSRGHGLGPGSQGSSAAPTPFFQTIWDGGGINVVDATGYTGNTVIDLREGHFSSIGAVGLSTPSTTPPTSGPTTGGFPEAVDATQGSPFEPTSAQENVSIAYAAVIQNAVGSSGTTDNDVIVGNAWNNILVGGPGINYVYSDGVVNDHDAGIDWSLQSGAAGSQWNDPNYIAPSTGQNIHKILLGQGGSNDFVIGIGDNVVDGAYNQTDVDNATSAWSTPGTSTYWDAAHQFTADPATGVANNASGTPLPSVNPNSAGPSTADYSHLSWEDPNIQQGSAGVTVTSSGSVDSNGNTIYTAEKGAGGADGTDTLINVTQFVGTAGEDVFTGDPNDFRNHTFFGSTGNDQYTAGGGSDLLDYSKLGNFDNLLTTTSAGVVLISTGVDANGLATYVIAKGSDGTDTAQGNFYFFNGSIGRDTFNIDNSMEFVTIAGESGSDIFNVSGGSFSTAFGSGGSFNTLYGDQVGEIGQHGTEDNNVLDLTSLGAGAFAGGDGYGAPGLQHDLQYGFSKFILGGGNDTYSDTPTLGSGLEHGYQLVEMSGANNTVSVANELPGSTFPTLATSVAASAIAVVKPDGAGGTTVLTSGGAEVHGAQIIDAPNVVSEQLGHSYNLLTGVKTMDYSQLGSNPLTITDSLGPANNFGSSFTWVHTVSDGQNSDTLNDSGVRGNWLVGSNNGDTYNLASNLSTTKSLVDDVSFWLGTGANTVNVARTDYGHFAEQYQFVYNGGDATFNGLTYNFAGAGVPNIGSNQAPLVTGDHIILNGVTYADVTPSIENLHSLGTVEDFNLGQNVNINQFDLVLDISNGGNVTGSVTITGLESETLASNPNGPATVIDMPTITTWDGTFNPTTGAPTDLSVVSNFTLAGIQFNSGTLPIEQGPQGQFFASAALPNNGYLADTNQNPITADNFGNAVIHGSTGNETLLGGIHNATIYAGTGNDVIDAQFGNDTIYGGAGNDEIHGGWGNDSIYAGTGNQTIFGEQGNQTIYAGSGTDLIVCGHGSDTVVVQTGNDTIYGNQGHQLYEFSNTGNATVMDYNPALDSLEYIDSTIGPQQIATARIGNDLHLTTATDPVTIHNFFADNTGQNQTIDLGFSSLGTGGSATFTVDPTGATVSIVVHTAGGNQAPVAENGSFTMNENAILHGNVLADNGNGPTVDPDGDAVTALAGTFTTAQGNHVNVATDGSFTYTPNAEFHGSDSFTYTAEDPQGATSTATITIGVTPDLPLVQNSSFTMQENGVLTGNVLADNGSGPATDPDGDIVGVQAGTFATAHGMVTLASNGDFTYTPNAGYHGAESFNFTVLDGQGDSSFGTVTVGIVADVPVAQNGTITVAENSAATGNVFADHGNGPVTDPDNDALTAQTGTFATANGSVTIAADGTYTYTPNAGFHGADSFSYTVMDGQGASASATISVGVTPDQPVAENGNFTVTENGTVSGNVLADNGFGPATDPDNDIAGVQAGTFNTANGSVTLAANGDFTYTPNQHFHGSDSFTYTLVDSQGETATAIINIGVAQGVPVVYNATFAASENTPFTGNVLANNGNGGAFDPDGDPVSAVAGTFTTAQGGTVVVAQNGNFTYTPAAGFHGADSFTYTGQDGQGASAMATVTLNVAPDLPVAQNGGITTNENTAATGNVLADNGNGPAGDPDGDLVGAIAGTFTTTQGGSVTVQQNGNFTYTPAAGFHGADSFVYSVVDSQGETASATLNVAVIPDTPVAENGTVSTTENSAITGSVLADHGNGPVTDPDNDISGVVAGTFATAHGNVTIAQNGGFTYTPDQGFIGSDSFNYTVLDGQDASATATINVNVNPILPVANNETIAVPYGQPVTGNVLADNGSGAAFDPDGDPVHAVSRTFTTAQGFTVVVATDGSFSVAAPSWFVGSDSFLYTVMDPDGNAATAVATINVAPPANAIVGTNGDDNIIDTSNVDHSIFCLGGNDIVHCGGGQDTVYCGPGSDTVYAGTGVDTFYAGPGSDTFYVNNTGDVVVDNYAQGGTDTIVTTVSFTAPAHVDNLVATGGANVTLTANNDGDTITTNIAIDTVHGGTGSDTIYVNNSNDVVTESAGTNTVIASVNFTDPNNVQTLQLTGNTSLSAVGNSQSNNLIANNAGDSLKETGSGTDVLIGGTGADTLKAGSGTTTILPGGGNDTVFLGTGQDTVVFKDATAFTGVVNLMNFVEGANSHLDVSDVVEHIDQNQQAINNFLEMTSTGHNSVLSANTASAANPHWVEIAQITHNAHLDLQTMINNGELIVR